MIPVFSSTTGEARETLLRKLRLILLLTPAVGVIVVLYLGGLALAGLQSLGYFPAAGLHTLSLDAYTTVVRRPDFLRSLWLTFWVSLVSTGLACLLGTLSALLMRSVLNHFPGRRQWIAFLYQFNLPIPHSVGAVGVLLLFSQSGLLARMAYAAGTIGSPADFPALVFDPLGVGIIIEYTWKTSVFTGVILLAALLSAGEDYEATAATLGAGAWQRFWYVTLPALHPALMSSSILVFAFTFGGYEVPYILGQRSASLLPVLAYREYSRVDLAARPEAMAISMLIAVLTTLMVAGYMRLARGNR